MLETHTTLQERLEHLVEHLPTLTELKARSAELEDEGFKRVDSSPDSPVWEWVDEELNTASLFVAPEGTTPETALIIIHAPESVFADEREYPESIVLDDVPTDLSGFLALQEEEGVVTHPTAAFWTTDGGEGWEYSEVYYDLIGDHQEDGGAYTLLRVFV